MSRSCSYIEGSASHLSMSRRWSARPFFVQSNELTNCLPKPTSPETDRKAAATEYRGAGRGICDLRRRRATLAPSQLPFDLYDWDEEQPWTGTRLLFSVLVVYSWIRNSRDAPVNKQIENREDTEPELLAAQAETFFSAGQLEQAERAIQDAIKAAQMSPAAGSRTHWQHYCILGRIWSAQERAHEALDAFRYSVRIAPPNAAPPHWHLGVSLLKAGELSDAEAEVRTAIRLNPKTSAFHSSLAAILLQQCFYDEAHASLRRALRLNRKNLEPRILLAELLSLRGDHRAAEKELSRALKLAPKSPGVLWAFTKLFEHQGRTDKAVEYARKLIENDPGNISLHVRISKQYATAGRHEEALAAMSEACRLDPENRAYRKRLADLVARNAPGAAVPLANAPEPATQSKPGVPETRRLGQKVRLFWLKISHR